MTRQPDSAAALPAFIPPMLAELGEPFDSDEHLFEIKWDGTRTLAFIEAGAVRLLNRRRIDTTARFPELEFLGGFPAGTVLDGELVVLAGGKPDFSRLQSREHMTSPLKIRTSAQAMPTTYVVFDQLYAGFKSVMDRTFQSRRALLADTLEGRQSPRLLLSEGVVGPGREYFRQAVERGLEGVMAKRLTARYLAGKRSEAWIKIKRRQSLVCAIIGFQPQEDDPRDLRSLILAADLGQGLVFVGKAGSGINERLRKRLNALLRQRLCKRPLVPCKSRGLWVEPGLYCEVSYLELTDGGEMRFPVFHRLIEE